MIQRRIFCITLLLLLTVWDKCALAQISWSVPYNLKKGHTLYASKYTSTGCSLTHVKVNGIELSNNPTGVSRDGENFFNEGYGLGGGVCSTDVSGTYSCTFNNSRLTQDPATTSSFSWYTSKADNTQVKIGVSSCKVIGTPGFANYEHQLLSSSQVPGKSLSLTVTSMWQFPNGTYEIPYPTEQIVFTDAVTPKTLVLFVAGFGADPLKEHPEDEYSNAGHDILIERLEEEMKRNGLKNNIDIGLFPDKGHYVGRKHRVVVQRFITYLTGIIEDLKENYDTEYANVFIITHSAGYVITKSAVLATQEKFYRDSEKGFYDYSEQKESLQKLFEKAQIYAVAPAMGGGTVGRLSFFPMYLNPAGGFQKWFAGLGEDEDIDGIFKRNVASFNSYMLVGDPMYSGIWVHREDKGYNPRASRIIANMLGFIFFNGKSNELETNYYEIAKSSGNMDGLPTEYRRSDPGIEEAIGKKKSDANIHFALLNYPPLIDSIVNDIITAAGGQ